MKRTGLKSGSAIILGIAAYLIVPEVALANSPINELLVTILMRTHDYAPAVAYGYVLFLFCFSLAIEVPMVALPLRRSVRWFPRLVLFIILINAVSFLGQQLIWNLLVSGLTATVFEAILIAGGYALVFRRRDGEHAKPILCVIALVVLADLVSCTLGLIAEFELLQIYSSIVCIIQNAYRP